MAKEWPAYTRWTSDAYIAHTLGNVEVPVAVTPNGFADAVVDGTYFCEPAMVPMPFSTFAEHLSNQAQGPYEKGRVYYIQSQNGNMKDEWKALVGDVPPSIDFCDEALRATPDAVNFWMGNASSVTSFHKDPYENLYAVICGEKVATDGWTLAMWYFIRSRVNGVEKEYIHATYDADTLDIVPTQPVTKIPWISVDPLRPNYTTCPNYKHAQPLIVHVQEGDVLYLPSLWYHHVQQVGQRVIAVNWWYDMHYGLGWVYNNLVRDVSKIVHEHQVSTHEKI